jgi:hypothetical protein
MADSKVLLRLAVRDDARSIAMLHTQSWQAAYRKILPAAYLRENVPAEHASHWESYMLRPAAARGLVMLAELNGTAIGFVSAEKVKFGPRIIALLPTCARDPSRTQSRAAHD